MQNRSRRKILKSLALSCPAAWSAPAVMSVTLPSHAQTSPTCELPLMFDDQVASCDLGESVLVAFYIDDTGDCPELVETTPGATPPGSAQLVEIDVDAEGGPSVAVEVFIDGVSVDDDSESCSGAFSGISARGPFPVAAVSGAGWQISFDFETTAAPIALAITNIELTPV